MNQPTPEDPLATLQAEIRRAGATVRSLRLATAGVLLVLIAFVWTPGVLSAARILREMLEHPVNDHWRYFRSHNDPRILMPAAVASIVVLVLAALLFAFVVALVFRRIEHGHLRKQLRALTRWDQAAVVLALSGDPRGDTRALVRSLARELGLPTEVTPAGTPDGTGAEVSGVFGTGAKAR